MEKVRIYFDREGNTLAFGLTIRRRSMSARNRMTM
jgi:hypothetical protein